MHVLLADDQQDVRSALRLLLEQEMGLVVIGEVADAEGLLVLAREKQPDLVLLDWELPGLQSEDLLSALRSFCPNVLVVALSGRLEARQASLHAGADAFVSKGDSPKSVLTVLQRVISCE